MQGKLVSHLICLQDKKTIRVFAKTPYKDTKKLTLINCLDVKIRSSFF